MTTIQLVPVLAIGTRTGGAFVTRQDGCSVEPMASPVYPPDDESRGERLRLLRRTCDLTLREAAAALDLKAAEVSAIERGAARPEPEGEVESRYRQGRTLR